VSRELVTVPVGGLPDAAARLFLELRPRTIALSGGSTPRPVYERFATLEYDWEHTDIFFGDERCVPPNHPDSNFGMAQQALLSKVPARAHPMDGRRCDAESYELELAAVFGTGRPAMDLVFLGLGEDGHTASLFPGDPALDETVRSVLRVARADHRRLTLTLPVLCAARVALFLVAGADKRAILARLLSDDDIPAARVHAARTIVVADRDAAPGG
jgi:6-phosphogluconolactonase